MHRFKQKNLLASFYAILLCTVFAYLTISFSSFPDKIQFLAGKENNFTLSFPFTAEIEPDSIAVVNVNNEPITENIVIDSNDEVSITSQSGESTEVDMNVSLLGVPLRKIGLNIMPEIEVVPCGMTVGVKLHTDGVLVLGTGSVTDIDGVVHRPSDSILKSGDMIIEVNDKEIINTQQMSDIIKDADETEVNFKIKRDDEVLDFAISPVKAKEDSISKIGCWVRDGTQGIGTVTYYNPKSNAFGALGHGILDVDTKKLMSIKQGNIYESNIVDIHKGTKGSPGELIGEINKSASLGEVKFNSDLGIYGNINRNYENLPVEKMKISLQGDIYEGPATIRSNIDGKEIKEYDVFIERVNKYSDDEAKGMVIRITDSEIISKTSGIVQGMSGSPIIQDGKLIGAVTHVFVQNPLKGYGVFIENMVKQEKNV